MPANVARYRLVALMRLHRMTFREIGKLPDENVAKRIVRPVNGVRLMRTRFGIPSANDRRRKVERNRRH